MHFSAPALKLHFQGSYANTYKLKELRRRGALVRIRVTNTVDALTLNLLARFPLK